MLSVGIIKARFNVTKIQHPTQTLSDFKRYRMI